MDKGSLRDILPVLSLGLVMGMCIGIGLALGLALDHWLDIAPYGTGLGVFWGLGAAIVQSGKIIGKALKAFNGRKKQDSAPRSPKC